MTKFKQETIKKIAKGVMTYAIAIATLEANVLCPYISYKPEKPDSVKKLRKF